MRQRLEHWRQAARRRRRRRWRKQLGRRGERAAARFLRRKRMVIVGRQVREGRGELDLIAVDGDTVVFVEVKTRTSHRTGHPADAVDAGKQRQLTMLALSYLHRHGLLECRWRFENVPRDPAPPCGPR